MILSALKFGDASTTTEVNFGSQGAFGNNASETRVVWCRFDGPGTGTRVVMTQGTGGPSNFAVTTGNTLNFSRDYTTTDANASVDWSAVNITIGQPWFGATVLSSGVPAIYGGTLTLPATEASAYRFGPVTAVGTLVDKSANNVRIGGFSGISQGFPGVIWWAAWFDYAMTVQELRDVQFHPERYKAKALGWWRLGANGTGLVLDESGHGIHGTISSGVVLTNDVLPRVLGLSRR